MKPALFPPDTRAPMPSFGHEDENGVTVWVKAWYRTPKGFVVKNVAVTDWEANVYAAALLAVEEESDVLD